MRTKLAFRNLVTGVLLQLVTAMCGFVIPRLFIVRYGSTVNGLVSSISQFVSYLSLVEVGLGTAGMVELYGPLSRDDHRETGAVLSDMSRFYRRAGMAYLALVVLLAATYPLVVRNQIGDASLVVLMVVALSANTLVDFFLLSTYRVLLMASQKTYLINLVQAGSKVLVAVLAALLMDRGCSAVAVKLSAVPLYLLGSLAIVALARREHPLLRMGKATGNHEFHQRRAAFMHQVIGVVCMNTDMALLTLLAGEDALAVVSVYSIYDLVAYALSSFVQMPEGSTTASFGQLIVSGDRGHLRKSFDAYEFLYLPVIVGAYACMLLLLHPFVRIYTAGFADAARYTGWQLVLMFTMSGFLRSARFPSATLIEASGHYEQTVWRSVVEGAINIAVSVALIPRWGIIGALVGSCAAFLYRTIDIILYSNSRFLGDALPTTVRRLARNVLVGAAVAGAGIPLADRLANGWTSWLVVAAASVMTMGAALAAVNVLCEHEVARDALSRLRGVGRS